MLTQTNFTKIKHKEANWLYAELKSHISFLAKSHENSLMRLFKKSHLAVRLYAELKLHILFLAKSHENSLMILNSKSLIKQ